jgi:hypothetical protein
MIGEEACILSDAAKTKERKLSSLRQRARATVNFELLQLKYSLHANMFIMMPTGSEMR